MRPIAATMALAMLLLACGAAPKGEQVPLLTGPLGCYAGGEGGPTGELTVDQQYGTSFAGRPVMWPTGYTGWHVGSVVEVRDKAGNLKATTGRKYHISHAYAPILIPNDDGSLAFEPANAFPAAADCPYHHDFIDCTANPTDGWCLPPEPPTTTPTPPVPLD
jgi:hypothetical protein